MGSGGASSGLIKNAPIIKSNGRSGGSLKDELNSGKKGGYETTRKFIKSQIGVDLNKYRDNFTRKYDKKDRTIIDWDKIPRNEQNALKKFQSSYGKTNYILESSGGLGYVIHTGKSLENYIKTMDRIWGKGKWKIR